MRLAGKTTVITGASSGIGRALACVVAEAGGVPVLLARDGDRLAAVAEELARRLPGSSRAAVVPCDVADRESLRLGLAEARRQRGDPDILINNAGISLYGPAERTGPEDVRDLLDVNLLGPVNAMLDVLPGMKHRGSGLIVNVASAAALRGVPYLAAYGASKAALASYAQSLRAEIAGSGVRVLTVYPGHTRTPLFQHEKRVGGARRRRGRYANPDRVARAIVRAIERSRNELVLSPEGRALHWLGRAAPSLLDRALVRLARRLRTPEDRLRARDAA